MTALVQRQAFEFVIKQSSPETVLDIISCPKKSTLTPVLGWLGVIQTGRLSALVLFVAIAIRICRTGAERGLALIAFALVSAVLFSDELGAIGMPGIWFPFNIGVSRTQYVLALAVPLLGLLMVRTLRREGLRDSDRQAAASAASSALRYDRARSTTGS